MSAKFEEVKEVDRDFIYALVELKKLGPDSTSRDLVEKFGSRKTSDWRLWVIPNAEAVRLAEKFCLHVEEAQHYASLVAVDRSARKHLEARRSAEEAKHAEEASK